MEFIHGTKIICIALAALMFSLILIPAGSATIGVKEGDWAKYGDIEAEIPEIAEEAMEAIEEIEWLKVEVQSVSDTTVNLEGTTHYKNGTEKTEPIYGTGTESGLIIEADLGEGDEVTASLLFLGPTTVYINGTVSRTYAGASREVNYVEITVTEEPTTSTIKAYWDKATGFLCEMSMSMSGEYEGETVEMSISYKMTETNMWQVAPLWMQWWFWAMVAVVIVALGGTVYLLKKRKPPTPTAPTPPSETSVE